MAAGDLVARIPSSRHADVVYGVRLQDGAYTCDCPGFSFRQRCRHVAALAALKAQPLEPTRDQSAAPIVARDDWDL